MEGEGWCSSQSEEFLDLRQSTIGNTRGSLSSLRVNLLDLILESQESSVLGLKWSEMIDQEIDQFELEIGDRSMTKPIEDLIEFLVRDRSIDVYQVTDPRPILGIVLQSSH